MYLGFQKERGDIMGDKEFEETMTKNVPILIKYINPQIKLSKPHRSQGGGKDYFIFPEGQ